MIVVSTTGAIPPEAKRRCLESVASQGAWHRHIYTHQPVDQHFPALIAAIDTLPDDTIVVSLDGDDWLTPGALAKVQRAHDEGALVTYGSFEYSDGRAGFAAQLAGPVRESPWVTTHLKTFRAGLFKRIHPTDLQDVAGQWLVNARDMAIMFPLVEMAGERAVYISDTLMVYNFANSDEFRKGPAFVDAERAAERYLRSLGRYERV